MFGYGIISAESRISRLVTVAIVILSLLSGAAAAAAHIPDSAAYKIIGLEKYGAVGKPLDYFAVETSCASYL